MILVIMGVSGTGKTTIGEELAKKMDCDFYDGDDFHPKANREKMQNKIPLNDDDRKPWLEKLRQLALTLINDGKSGVIACSALKRKYRQWLTHNVDGIFFVYLKGSYETIEKRMLNREGHYMPVSLLKSQFETLEEPEDEEAFRVSIELSIDTIVKAILETHYGQ